MKFSSSGTSTVNLNKDTQDNELIILKVEDEIAELIEGLEHYKIGIIFAIVDLRIQANLSNLERAIIPVINAEDSTATKVLQTNSSELASERMAIQFRVSGNTILRKRIVNYGRENTIPLISKIGEKAKYLKRSDDLSVSLIDLGYGLIKGSDSIDVTCDYLIEISGENLKANLLLNFEDDE